MELPLQSDLVWSGNQKVALKKLKSPSGLEYDRLFH